MIVGAAGGGGGGLLLLWPLLLLLLLLLPLAAHAGGDAHLLKLLEDCHQSLFQGFRTTWHHRIAKGGTGVTVDVPGAAQIHALPLEPPCCCQPASAEMDAHLRLAAASGPQSKASAWCSACPGGPQ